jgi:Concanavalin A-like lectin/glucanases superfamily/Domain of unknown function (DUF2341)
VKSKACLFVLGFIILSLPWWLTAVPQRIQGPPDVTPAAQHDVSPPVGGIPQLLDERPPHEKFLGPLHVTGPITPDQALQLQVGPAVASTAGLNFDGVGVGLGGFVPNAAPPDTNGAVGATQYVQWVNGSFAVFNKTTGSLLYGPVAGNTLWSGFGAPCQTNNDGDPVAQYDKLADRWVMSQFAVTGGPPYYLCVAVSTTSDATGSYNRYAFSYSNLNDYPKLGVWPDAYYVSFNMFNGNSFVGSRVCALDRTAMLAGSVATQQCFQLSSSFGGVLPSDLDGTTTPPAGAPNYFVNFGTNSLNFWQFHVSWSNPSSTTLTGPINIPVAAFSPACNGGACIPQSGSPPQKLDSLGDRLMYRLAYRNFGDHEALVVNHSVTAGNSVGVRWYEIRTPSTPVVHQQGTYAPDSLYRWMGSIAMDRVGNIAVGYSVSSGSMHPAIRYTGRAPSDALGTLAAESSIIEGGGSQGKFLNRWGDYSAMTVDPVDDCTFWYTNEYLKTNGTFNWSTRIVSFKFPTCGGPAAPTGLSATSGNSQVSLSWNSSSGATSYNVLRSTTSGGPYTSIATGITNTNYLDGSLLNGTTYYYVVQAVNAAGTSPNSNQASATPCAPPSPPTGLVATSGIGQVTLGWTASSGAISYSVGRSTVSGGPYSTIATGVSTTGYTDTSVTSGITYYYVVIAINPCGQSGNSNQASATPTGGGGGGWPNGYSFRRTITIDHTKVPNTDQSNFPMLIAGTYTYLRTTGNGGNVTNVNGYDILFTSDPNGSNALNYEREIYNASTGAVALWVKVPLLSHTSDTVLYMFYGNASVTTDQSNKPAVWDGNYLGVWHLPDGSSLTGLDSTANHYNLTNTNAVTATAGQIDGAANFNGSNNYLSNGAISVAPGSSITISFWNNVATANLQPASAFSLGNSENPNRIHAHAPWSDKRLYWDYGDYFNGGRISTDYTSYLDGWTYVTLTFNASDNSHRIYLNGTQSASSVNSNVPVNTQTGISIGAWTAIPFYEKGSIDEFRVSNSARSADWIATDYNNQSNPSTFYTVGAAQ